MAYLRNFPDNELIFNEEETRQILMFFFPHDKDVIGKLAIDNAVRNFAQGLLVEAVDATYAMGYVVSIFQTAYRFKGSSDFLKTFGRKAMTHWFKHATRSDLMRVKIYESVRLQLETNFRRYFHFIKNGMARLKGRSMPSTMVPSQYAKRTHEITWG